MPIDFGLCNGVGSVNQIDEVGTCISVWTIFYTSVVVQQVDKSYFCCMLAQQKGRRPPLDKRRSDCGIRLNNLIDGDDNMLMPALRTLQRSNRRAASMNQYEIKDGVAIIPQGTKVIENNAFALCTSLTTITLKSVSPRNSTTKSQNSNLRRRQKLRNRG